MLLGGEPLDGPRHIYWNFVSSWQDRILQAAEDWRTRRFAEVPGDDDYIPLPDTGGALAIQVITAQQYRCAFCVLQVRRGLWRGYELTVAGSAAILAIPPESKRSINPVRHNRAYGALLVTAY
nr:pirin-like C-terminal cupin domain-containing protein [uncultured Pseudomonas sp.]